MSGANKKPRTLCACEKRGLQPEMGTPVDLELQGWVTLAWPKPAETLFKDFSSCAILHFQSDVPHWRNTPPGFATNVIGGGTAGRKCLISPRNQVTVMTEG